MGAAAFQNAGRWAALPLFWALAGCGGNGAPVAPLLGAYFPGWLVAALIGVLAAILARLALALTGWDAFVPWLLAVCSSIGLIAAIALSAVMFG